MKTPEKRADEIATAKAEYVALAAAGKAVEELASKVYARFMKDGISKAISAQYLASALAEAVQTGQLTAADLRGRLPKYLVAAIEHVTEPLPVLP